MKGVQTPGNLVKEVKTLSYAWMSEQLREKAAHLDPHPTECGEFGLLSKVPAQPWLVWLSGLSVGLQTEG